MPEIRDRLQRTPLAGIRRRDGVTDIAPKGQPRWVVRRAHLTTIQRGNGGIKTRIQGANIFSVQISGGTQDAIWHGRDYSAVR